MSNVLNHAEAVLEQAGLEVAETRDLPTGHGWQIRCPGGEIVAVYKTGKIVAQGRNQAAVKALFDAAPFASKPAGRVPAPRNRAAGTPEAAAAPTTDPIPRFSAGWTTEPWDGVSVPF
jgi:predicted nucleotide-binding protein